jgi:hypothetical protein
MGLNLSNQHIAQELDRQPADVHQMTRQWRHGIGSKKPAPTWSDAVECDEVDIVAGHKGKPAAVVNKGGVAGAGGSRASADAAHSYRRSRRSSGWASAVAKWWFGCLPMSNKQQASRWFKRQVHRARVCTRMHTTSTAAWSHGAMRIRASVIAAANRHEMTTVMAFMKCTSTRWKGFGPYGDHGCARTEAFHQTSYRCIWASLRLSTMWDAEVKRCWERYLSCYSRSSLEHKLSQEINDPFLSHMNGGAIESWETLPRCSEKVRLYVYAESLAVLSNWLYQGYGEVLQWKEDIGYFFARQLDALIPPKYFALFWPSDHNRPPTFADCIRLIQHDFLCSIGTPGYYLKGAPPDRELTIGVYVKVGHNAKPMYETVPQFIRT